MKETRLWKINESESKELEIEPIKSVKETETEDQLEEVITRCPELLMEDLILIGRQTETSGGPLDLLGVDGDGRIVVFELKRGTLTRDAVAQIIDYSSYLADLEPEELSRHISSRSGKLGIEKIDDFLSWYQEEFSMSFLEYQRPRMVLVGLGADEKTKRMVSFLSESDLDISLITFHGFQKDNEIFLARQVEVHSKPQSQTTASTKIGNLEILKSKIKKLKVEAFYNDMAAFVRDKLPVAYEWPNQGGYSYSLPEQTESGSLSNRVYVALYVHDGKPGQVQIYLYSRSIEAASNYFGLEFKKHLKERLNKRSEGAYSIQVNSEKDWINLKETFGALYTEILKGWKQKRDSQSRDEFESAETVSTGNEQSESTNN